VRYLKAGARLRLQVLSTSYGRSAPVGVLHIVQI